MNKTKKTISPTCIKKKEYKIFLVSLSDTIINPKNKSHKVFVD